MHYSTSHRLFCLLAYIPNNFASHTDSKIAADKQNLSIFSLIYLKKKTKINADYC